MKQISILDKHKRIAEVMIIIASIIVFIGFLGLIITFASRMMELGIIFSAIMILSTGFLIYFSVKYFKIKKTYQSIVEKNIKRLSFAGKYQVIERIKDLKTLRKLEMIPIFNLFVKEHVLSVTHQSFDFEVSEAYALFSNGKSSSISFLGTMYVFDLDEFYEHTVFTTNKRLKVKSIQAIINQDKAFRLYGRKIDLDALYIDAKLKSLTIVLKDHKAYILLEKKRRRFEYSGFRRLEEINLMQLEDSMIEEFNQVIENLKIFIKS